MVFLLFSDKALVQFSNFSGGWTQRGQYIGGMDFQRCRPTEYAYAIFDNVNDSPRFYIIVAKFFSIYYKFLFHKIHICQKLISHFQKYIVQ